MLSLVKNLFKEILAYSLGELGCVPFCECGFSSSSSFALPNSEVSPIITIQ